MDNWKNLLSILIIENYKYNEKPTYKFFNISVQTQIC